LAGNLTLINRWMARDKSVNLLKLWARRWRVNQGETTDLIYTYILQEDF